MVYEYKERSMIKAPAQVAGEMCEQLAKTGGLTPKRLVEANRDEKAPLHSEFEWNDEIAAEAYRESQAAHIIRCLVVKTEEQPQIPVRAFVRVVEEAKDYTPMQVVMKNPLLMDVLLDNARKEMDSFVKKYRDIEDLQGVISAMNVVLRQRRYSNQEAVRPAAQL